MTEDKIRNLENANPEEFEEKTKHYLANQQEAIDKVVNSKLTIKQIKLILRANPSISKEEREECIREVKRLRNEA